MGFQSQDRYGKALALSNSGNTVVVGVKAGSTGLSGSVDIYRYNSNNNQWNQLGDVISGDFADLFGDYVAISADGNTVAGTSLTFSGSRGLVRVFRFNGGTWNQLGSDVLGEDSSDKWGTSVAMSQDGLVVAAGSPTNDAFGNAAGSVRVFVYSDNAWTQLGQTLLGEETTSQFGSAVALSGNGRVMVASAPRFDGDGPNNIPGLVRVFQYNSATNFWDRKGQGILGVGNGDMSGISVAINADGNIIAIGSEENDASFRRAGHVRVFEYNTSSDSWNLLGNDIRGEAQGDLSGASISLSSQGTTLAVGAKENEGAGNSAGHIRIYRYRNSNWNQVGADIEATRAGDEFGTAVSLSGSGSIVAGGSPFFDFVNGDNPNIGEVRIFEFG